MTNIDKTTNRCNNSDCDKKFECARYLRYLEDLKHSQKNEIYIHHFKQNDCEFLIKVSK
jgi:hypothetical protein